ncbi:MAG: two pore domain potassium channel family protein, partial [Ramlibacter sp.]|nr:two pore domain potassium channel family protein [Ramlibacter sp.]
MPASFLYFSIETYTSLGFGDVFPLGQIRMLAGMEALTGLLMISWTASFTYLEMSRFWP